MGNPFNNKLNILVYNRHEPYIGMLAKTGHQFYIYEPFVPALGKVRKWMHNLRPVPENATLITRKERDEGLKKGRYDLVICHDYQDLGNTKFFPIPKALIFHTRFYYTNEDLATQGITKREFIDKLVYLINILNDVYIVFISGYIKESWELGIHSRVITPGIDLNDYHGYTGEKVRLLRVRNGLKERQIFTGYNEHELLVSGFPLTLIGHNPSISYSKPSKNWNDLKEYYRSHRVYITTIPDGAEEGYGLAVLEAMATGMPVIATWNSSSPVIDGYNGFISNDLSYLRERIKFLLNDREEAVRLGLNARKTMEEKFNIKDFVAKWNEVFYEMVNTNSKNYFATDLH